MLLARCGYTLRITSQASYSPEYITPLPTQTTFEKTYTRDSKTSNCTRPSARAILIVFEKLMHSCMLYPLETILLPTIILISYIKVLLVCDWLISVQLIPNSSANSAHAITVQFSVITMNQSKLSYVLAGKIKNILFSKHKQHGRI